ncbi:MAPEG family protein [soil metagenome]
MSSELTVLALAGLLAAIQFALMSVPLNIQLGPKKTLGPRDEPLEPKGVPARLYRALNNLFEALILFTLAVVVVTLSGASSAFTAACAWIFLAARILYVPAYAFGWVPWRSVIFGIGFAATLAMLLAALL